MATAFPSGIPRAPGVAEPPPLRVAPTRSTSAAGRVLTAAHTAARWAAGPARRASARAAVKVRSLALQGAGLGAATYGAWQIAETAGWFTGAAALFVAEYLIRSDR